MPSAPRRKAPRRRRRSSGSRTALTRKIAALPPAKRAAVADFVERLLDEDRPIVTAASRASEAVFGRIWDNPDDAAYDRL